MAKATDPVILIIKKYLAELIRNEIPVQEAFLFGSCARGEQNEASDIDIAIISNAFCGDRFEDRRRIVPLRRQIDSRLEPMPFRPDDFATGGILADEIKRTGIRVIL